MSEPGRARRILLTGASGYVGGRLLRALGERGESVRCLARRPERLASRAGSGTEVVRGDVLDAASLDRALRGVDAAYYLVHAMDAGADFEARDRRGAQCFAAAARRAGLRRIVYLGGLADEGESLSPHMRSRHEVGRILRASGVPTIELRASIVIGSGSLSFEMIRALVNRLPVMVTPRWVGVPAQPIGVEDLLAYLLEALEVACAPTGEVFEIGGAERMSYGGLMREVARQQGLRRIMVDVPLLTPRLSSLWLGLVTPLYARVGRVLVDSIRHPSVVRDDRARRCFRVEPRPVSRAIARALAYEDRELAETRWCDSLPEPRVPRPERFARRRVDSRALRVPLPPEAAFAPIARIGGDAGWYGLDWLWRLRGAIDLLAGGVGMRRGRRDPLRLRPGDVVDWWRVEACEPGWRLRLAAEMRLPGRAWLEFQVRPCEGGSEIRQTAEFDPRGRAGLLYWYAILPVHQLVFNRMLAGIARAAREGAGRPAPTPGPIAGGRGRGPGIS
jgi:uncharacterized protein YbjT (DUF2867 family)